MIIYDRIVERIIHGVMIGNKLRLMMSQIIVLDLYYSPIRQLYQTPTSVRVRAKETALFILSESNLGF
jgi:hypothetical protein